MIRALGRSAVFLTLLGVAPLSGQTEVSVIDSGATLREATPVPGTLEARRALFSGWHGVLPTPSIRYDCLVGRYRGAVVVGGLLGAAMGAGGMVVALGVWGGAPPSGRM